MNVFRIAASGLSSQDKLVLRSSLRLRSSADSVWSFVEDAAEADVVLRRLAPTLSDQGGAPAYEGILPQLARLDLGTASGDLLASPLMLPLRARELVPQLRVAELSLHRELHAKRSTAPSVGHTNVLNLLLSDDGPLRCSSGLLRLGEHHLLLIESAKSTSVAPVRSRHWRSFTVRDTTTLFDALRLGRLLSLHPTTIDLAEAQDLAPISGNVGQLAWALALTDPHPQLMAGLDSAWQMKLMRWPDVVGMPMSVWQIRMAAALTKGVSSLSELIALSNASQSEAIAFVNACHGIGHLATGSSDEATQVAAPPRPVADRLGGLVDSIRVALRALTLKENR